MNGQDARVTTPDDPDLVKAARKMQNEGGSVPDVATWLVQVRGLQPIPAIKVLRELDVSLTEAKLAVDAALPATTRAANDELRRSAVENMDSLAQED
jgi:ribosomal protein L7/L12